MRESLMLEMKRGAWPAGRPVSDVHVMGRGGERTRMSNHRQQSIKACFNTLSKLMTVVVLIILIILMIK